MDFKELSQLYYLNREIEADKKRLDEISSLQKIPDSITRQIFTLRFINGLSWVQIAFHIGGGNTADGVRKRLFRHLKNSKK